MVRIKKLNLEKQFLELTDKREKWVNLQGDKVVRRKSNANKTWMRWHYLPTVSYLLVEDAIFVADAVAVRCQAQSGHGIQEACWEQGIKAIKSVRNLYTGSVGLNLETKTEVRGVSGRGEQLALCVSTSLWFWVPLNVLNDLSGGEIIAHCFTCQSAQASVSQPRVLLHLLQLLHVQAQLQQRGTGKRDAAVMKRGVTQTFESDLVDGLVAGVLQPQVDHGVLERPAHVELQRQIIDPLNMRGRRKTPQ